jgi:hypothetical protein
MAETVNTDRNRRCARAQLIATRLPQHRAEGIEPTDRMTATEDTQFPEKIGQGGGEGRTARLAMHAQGKPKCFCSLEPGGVAELSVGPLMD